MSVFSFHVEEIFYYWRSNRSFVDAWCTDEKFEDCDVANVIDGRDLRRRRSCPGFVTLWEQFSASGPVSRRKRPKKKVNKQNVRRATRKFAQWVDDTEICRQCFHTVWTGGPGHTDKPAFYSCHYCDTTRHSSSSYYCSFCDINVCIRCAKNTLSSKEKS